MASSVQILRYTQSPIPASQPKFSAKSSLLFSEFHSRKRILRLPNSSSSRYNATKRFRVCCGAQDSDKETNGMLCIFGEFQVILVVVCFFFFFNLGYCVFVSGLMEKFLLCQFISKTRIILCLIAEKLGGKIVRK